MTKRDLQHNLRLWRMMKKQDIHTVISLHFQVLQGNTRGHRGVWRHQRRVFRQRQTVVAWNQSELRRRVSNIRWARAAVGSRHARSKRPQQPSDADCGGGGLFGSSFNSQWETKTTTPTLKWSRRRTRRSLQSRWESTFLRRAQRRTSTLKRYLKTTTQCTCQINRRLLLVSPPWPHVVSACRCSTASQSWC